MFVLHQNQQIWLICNYQVDCFKPFGRKSWFKMEFFICFNVTPRQEEKTKKKLHLQKIRFENRLDFEFVDCFRMRCLKDTKIYRWCIQISGFVELSISCYKNRWHLNDKLLKRKKYWAKKNNEKNKREKKKRRSAHEDRFHFKKELRLRR